MTGHDVTLWAEIATWAATLAEAEGVTPHTAGPIGTQPFGSPRGCTPSGVPLGVQPTSPVKMRVDIARCS